MFNRLGRWLRGSAPPAASQSVKAWACARGYQYRAGDESWGFRIEGRHEAHNWHMEYGRPQRHYIQGAELRLRLDLKLPPALSLMLLSRQLMDQLETTAFNGYVQGFSNRTERSSREEMRWLALYPKVALHAVSGLRRHFGMVGSSPEAAHQWLHGSLGERLAALPGKGWCGEPLLLMIGGGHLCLRLELQDLELDGVEEVLELFLVAATRAQEALSGWGEGNDGTWLSTTSIAWQGGELHVELPLDLPSTSKN